MWFAYAPERPLRRSVHRRRSVRRRHLRRHRRRDVQVLPALHLGVERGAFLEQRVRDVDVERSDRAQPIALADLSRGATTSVQTLNARSFRT
jgi:hypothetical protein